MTIGKETQPVPDLDQRIVAEIPRLRAFLRKRAPGEAEDLLQDVLERALRYRSAFHEEGSLRGWLMKTAYRTFLDHRRHQARAPALLKEGEDLIPARPARDAGLQEEVDRWLKRLSPDEREVLVRFHAGGETLADIGKALRMPVNTVKSHLHRARKKLAGLAPEAERQGNNDKGTNEHDA